MNKKNLNHPSLNYKLQIGNYSFTLIELVVAIGVIAISLPIIFDLFFLTLQTRSKIYILQEIKRNGDYALNTMQNIIKHHVYAIYSDPELTIEVCSTKSKLDTPAVFNPSASANLYFKDPYGNLFYFYTDDTEKKIASYSAITNPNIQPLTGENVAVEPENFILSCSRTSIFSPPIVTISFSISQANKPTHHEEKASLNYQTKIKLKNY